MQDAAPVLIAICGFLFVGFGLVVVIAYLVLKFTGKTLIGAFGNMGGILAALGEGGEESAPAEARAPRRSLSRRDLRARAESLDFDAAVARQAQSPPVQSAAARPSPPPLSSDDLPALRRSRTVGTTSGPAARRRRKDDDDENDDNMYIFMDDLMNE